MLASLSKSYWRHHGLFLNIRTAVRPSADVCKSDREARARYAKKKLITVCINVCL